MQASPNDPAAAARASESLAAAGRWQDVLPVAQQWRQRLGASPVAADTMIAMAHLATGNPQAARTQLDPYVSTAVEDPVANVSVLNLYARALVALRRATDARALLEPTLSAGPAPRDVWIRIALQIVPEADTARQWLDVVEPLISSTPSEERFGLATARVQLARRFDSTPLQADADAAVRKLADSMKESVSKDDRMWLALGVLQELQGDDVSAEASYRHSIELGSKNPIVSNNLALIIERRNGDMNEAIRLGEDASKDAANRNRDEFFDTLALMQAKAGQYDAAAKSINEAILLKPQKPSLRMRQIEIQLSANRAADAQKSLSDLENLVATMPQPDPALLAKVEALRAEVHAATAAADK
jgi:Tfp pilus assembly protein PilF